MGASSPRKRSRQYKAAERAEFFRRLDRGGTIRAVAAELGLSPDTCYRWRHESGTSTARGIPRTYTAQDKAEFFRRLALNPNVSAVARELGFVRVTCYKWAHQAGIFTGKDVTAQREEFLRLRAEGLSRAQAAARVGVDKRRAQDWDKGIRQFYGGRVYPDGRVVRYGQAGILANVKTPRTAYTRGVPDDLQRLERPISDRYLSLEEREQIHDLHVRGDSVRAIARALNRAPSTIGRELTRNTATAAGYLPYAAHRLAVARRPRPRQGKLQVLAVMHGYVATGLDQKWSPEQISHRMVIDFPADPRMRVCTETIYQAIYAPDRTGLTRAAAPVLRCRRAARRPRRDPARRRSRFVEPMVPITDRPAEAEDRTVPGHWEGDLILGKLSGSAIGTLVERATRYVTLVHLAHDHTAETVRDGLIATVNQWPTGLRRSLTWDQGAEMSHHASLRRATGIDVFFCDAASPWQRGSNENMNGLLRQYFPKSTNLSAHTVEDLHNVARELNSRPRKSLGWATPTERLRALLEPG